MNNATAFGSPSLAAGQQRTFAIQDSQCNLPAAVFASGGAISLNVTAVPIAAHSVSYLTVWGSLPSQPQPPLVSTLNDPTGTVVANAAVVSINPSTSESVSVYATDNTDLILDITGYFAPASLAPSGVALYTFAPCRILNTRYINLKHSPEKLCELVHHFRRMPFEALREEPFKQLAL